MPLESSTKSNDTFTNPTFLSVTPATTAAASDQNNSETLPLSQVPSSTHTRVPGDEDESDDTKPLADPHNAVSCLSGCTDMLSVPFLGIEDAVRQHKNRTLSDINSAKPYSDTVSMAKTPASNISNATRLTKDPREGSRAKSGAGVPPRQVDSCLSGCTDVISVSNFDAGRGLVPPHNAESCLSGCTAVISAPNFPDSSRPPPHNADSCLSGCTAVISAPNFADPGTKNVVQRHLNPQTHPNSVDGILSGCSSVISMPSNVASTSPAATRQQNPSGGKMQQQPSVNEKPKAQK